MKDNKEEGQTKEESKEGVKEEVKTKVNTGSKKLNLVQFMAARGVVGRDIYVANRLLPNEENMTIKKWEAKFDEKGIDHN